MTHTNGKHKQQNYQEKGNQRPHPHTQISKQTDKQTKKETKEQTNTRYIYIYVYIHVREEQII